MTEPCSFKTANSSWIRFRRWRITIPVVAGVRFVFTATQRVGLDESWIEHPQLGQRPRWDFSTSLGFIHVSGGSSGVVPPISCLPPSMLFVFLLAFSHSLTLFPLFLYLSSLAHAHIYLAMSGRTSFCIYPLVFGYKREDVDIRMRRLGGCCRCRMSNIFAGRPFELGVGTVFALSQGDESSNWRWRVL